jgi:hypothetical protein
MTGGIVDPNIQENGRIDWLSGRARQLSAIGIELEPVQLSVPYPKAPAIRGLSAPNLDVLRVLLPDHAFAQRLGCYGERWIRPRDADTDLRRGLALMIAPTV